MVIETRYRDIDDAEIDKVHARLPEDDFDWNSVRGKPVRVVIPHMPDDSLDWCGEHWYRVDGSDAVVCPHLAEIGD